MSGRTPLGLPGWEYEVVGHGTFITVAGHRTDEPAALPLVTAARRTETEAIIALREKAVEWDAQQGRDVNVRVQQGFHPPRTVSEQEDFDARR